MKSLLFKKLWLVSETERAARSVEFDKSKTLLVGRNHTGKSTIVKHIFRTLGCEVKGTTDRWDKLAVSVLQFDLDDKPFTAYRKSNVFALQDDTTRSLKVAIKSGKWTEIIADLLEFKLQLPTHDDKLAQATPAFLFLPFYMDQDSSWQHQWNAFDKLSQFSDWKRSFISYFTGQKPNGYYVAKFDETQAKARASQIRQELGVVESALLRVNKTLPKPKIRLNVNVFKQEINELLRESSHLKSEQEALRQKVFESAATRESLLGQISSARHALKELEGDLKYLTETNTDPTVTCPTCGTIHESGFLVRLDVIDDASVIRKILAELESDLRKVDTSLADLNSRISRLVFRTAQIEGTLQKKRGKLKLQDVIENRSSEVVHDVFRGDIASMKLKLSQQEDNIKGLKEIVDSYDMPQKTKEINDYYSDMLSVFASELEVQDLNSEIRNKPDARLKTGGSALPRAFLAYQYAILYTYKEKADKKIFPFVVDSPNQQGQDPVHLMQMLKFITRRTPIDQQLILAVEDKQKDFVFDGKILEYTIPYGLLLQDQYDIALNELKPLVEAVEGQVNELLQNAQSEPDEITSEL